MKSTTVYGASAASNSITTAGTTQVYTGAAYIVKLIVQISGGGTYPPTTGITVYDSNGTSTSVVGTFVPSVSPYGTGPFNTTVTDVFELNWPVQNGIAIGVPGGGPPYFSASISYDPA